MERRTRKKNVRLWWSGDIWDFLLSYYRQSTHSEDEIKEKTVSCDAYSNISGSDLNASDFIWLLLDSRARTRRPKINDYILDETIVLHNIAFEFLCSQLSCKMKAHFFIRRHKRTNLWIYRILLQTFDIQMVAVAAGTWHEISEWMMSIHTANEKGIVWIVNGRWKWIESQNIRTQFPVTH